jgi:predicted transcriptional regulator
MKRSIKLTERDLSRIVKRVINENMDNDTALNVYRKLKQEGEIMDETYKRIRNIREELDVMVMNHVRSGTANTIFDYDQRTPNEVSENVQRLSIKINELEGILSQYKRFVKGAISL